MNFTLIIAININITKVVAVFFCENTSTDGKCKICT